MDLIPIAVSIPGELDILIPQIAMIKSRVVHFLHRLSHLFQKIDKDITRLLLGVDISQSFLETRKLTQIL